MRLKTLLSNLSAISCLTFAAVPAMAIPFAPAPADTSDPHFFLGFTVAFGAGGGAKTGVTAKILSSDGQDKWVAAAGVSYYFTPNDNWGIDLSAGYNFDNFSVLGGYDFLQRAPVASFGWSDTKQEAAADPQVIVIQGPGPN